MRGVTLLEFLAGVLLFLLLLFFCYHALDSQRRLLRNVAARVEPEVESNYRLLLLKNFLEGTTGPLQGDPFLEMAPVVFPDLSFGASPQANAFSVARVTGRPFAFDRSGFHYRVAAGAPVISEKTYLLAGSDAGGNYTWNYARVEQTVPSGQSVLVRMQPFTANPEAQTGTLVEVELHGFLFQNQTLHWISPAGLNQPYFTSLDTFEYKWTPPLLKVSWKKGEIKTEFQCRI